MLYTYVKTNYCRSIIPPKDVLKEIISLGQSKSYTTVKLLEENIGENLCGLGLNRDSLSKTYQKAQTI